MVDSLRLLLIDDDELDRRIVVRALKQHHADRYEIIECATASEGLVQIAKQQFDAILLDYRLPDKNGLEVLRSLRSRLFPSTPIPRNER